MAVFLFAYVNPVNAQIKRVKTSFSTKGKKVTVYTTADNSSLRLSKTATVEFVPMVQPLETQICIFADPDKTFQTFLGIGGALTDAAAETFAKLPLHVKETLKGAFTALV